jgi:NAD-specific glutamate dehydrogenase
MSKEGSVTLEAIKSHQLKNEIISTSIINQVINRLGITFITNIATESGLEHHEVVKFYIAIREIFGMEKIWSIIDSMDFTEEWSKRLKLISKTLDFVESSIFWLISNAKHSLSLSELISFYQPIISIVRQNFKTTKQSQIELEMDFLNYMSVSIYSAKYIALKEMDYKIVAESFEKTLTLFGIDIISQTYESFLSSLATNVEKSAVKILFRKLMSSISDISYKLAKEAKQKSVDDQINQFTNSRSAIFSSYQNLVNNLQTKDGSDSKIAILSLIYDKIQLIELS